MCKIKLRDGDRTGQRRTGGLTYRPLLSTCRVGRTTFETEQDKGGLGTVLPSIVIQPVEKDDL